MFTLEVELAKARVHETQQTGGANPVLARIRSTIVWAQRAACRKMLQDYRGAELDRGLARQDEPLSSMCTGIFKAPHRDQVCSRVHEGVPEAGPILRGAIRIGCVNGEAKCLFGFTVLKLRLCEVDRESRALCVSGAGPSQ